MAKVESTDDWMYDEGRDVGASVYRDKLAEVRSLAGPIFLRMSEMGEREKAVETARKTLSDVTTLVSGYYHLLLLLIEMHGGSWLSTA